ncbi:MAG TPA: hypothetical protein VJ672_04170 [Gemmatimonadaceae bacterium]|nr:hypothetical protein [Gemmatimonadaceae bacterium]
MSDEKLDQFIDEAAKEYNRPSGRVPREEMWARIERGRTNRHETAATPAHVAPPITPLRRRTQWIAVTAAIAAALAIGVLVGRFWERAPTSITAENRPNQPGGQGGLEKQEATDSLLPNASPDARELASTAPEPRTPGSRGGSDARDSRSDRSYEVATMNHLAQMEALLTTFRASNRDGQVDAQLSTWARDLLSSTRLLLDSPAAEDAKNRRLLEDLELVLVQIVNLAPNSGASDRGSIERTLENGQVMMRLRTAVPAGGLPTGT